MKKKIKINGKKVTAIVFKDGGPIPIKELPDNVEVEIQGFGDNEAKVISSSTSIIQGKNLISGSTITTKGDFHLGDK